MNFAKYIDIPYMKSGVTKNGTDCFGLVYLIYKEELGIELPKLNHIGYDSKTWYKEKGKQITNNIDTLWYRVDAPYKVYDGLIFTRYNGSKIADHIGMYIGNNKFIHVEERSTSRVERLNGTPFEERLYAAVRYKGVV